MTRIIVKEIIFDTWNKEHIKKHGVTEEEVKEAGESLIYHKRTYKRRYLLIGRAGRRLISLVLIRKGEGKYYLITARDASKKERRKVYEKECKKQNPRIQNSQRGGEILG